jgi:hypothetical protein
MVADHQERASQAAEVGPGAAILPDYHWRLSGEGKSATWHALQGPQGQGEPWGRCGGCRTPLRRKSGEPKRKAAKSPRRWSCVNESCFRTTTRRSPANPEPRRRRGQSPSTCTGRSWKKVSGGTCVAVLSAHSTSVGFPNQPLPRSRDNRRDHSKR